jgi:hypothetical protein
LCSSLVLDLEVVFFKHYLSIFKRRFISAHIHFYACSPFRIKWICLHALIRIKCVCDSFLTVYAWLHAYPFSSASVLVLNLYVRLLQVIRIHWKHSTGPSALSYAFSLS